MTKALSHIRKASAKLGDDITFSRFVKIRGADKKVHGRPRMLKLPGLKHPATVEARTYFKKSVRSPDSMRNLLVSGHSNVKIGRDVRVGKLRGHWLYTLSLEERATCPSSCFHWETCYGNAMPYAKRINHRAADFLPRLETEIMERMAPQKAWGGRRLRTGIIIRLHALGDFYDVPYVQFWRRMLVTHPTLVIFGYTARHPGTPVGDAVNEMIDSFPGRAMIRFSDGGMATRSTVSIVDADTCPPGAFVCPEQTGQFEACGKCGACWSTLKNVAFMSH